MFGFPRLRALVAEHGEEVDLVDLYSTTMGAATLA
jgi:hypothetical protein